ncbi:MAG: hypothetical protein IJZ23_03010 [Roseburia sp.]|nr:hypothetical protein [Roseburia sp.]
MLNKKQWFYNLITLIVLISGMCVDEVRADSVFACPNVSVISYIEVTDAVISEPEVQVTELLCTRNTISNGHIIAQIMNGKREIKLSMLFLCMAVFSLLLSNFYTAERVVEIQKNGIRTVVLDYIHNADGKK